MLSGHGKRHEQKGGREINGKENFSIYKKGPGLKLLREVFIKLPSDYDAELENIFNTPKERK